MKANILDLVKYFILSIILFSCQNNSKNPTSLRLKELYLDGYLDREYFYDEDGNITKIIHQPYDPERTFESIITRNGSNTRVTNTYIKSGIINSTNTYTKRNDNLYIRVDSIFNLEGNLDNVKEIEYYYEDPNFGYSKLIVNYDENYSNSNDVYIGTYLDENGSIMEDITSTYKDGREVTSKRYKYKDNSPNIFANTHIIQKNYRIKSGNITNGYYLTWYGDTSFVWQYEYTFENGIPVSSIYTSRFPNSDNSSSKQQTLYEYKYY
ncbi:hypothetical protein KMW28_05055 [Flammeovirga yaeyamensis]|uniref:YD repeat-containing protein n=1 Tax=Flammeovirga yaeyamensis TaxID=367791 RepID=A0AAX1N650_9BACT|nr:hypothetical protein [Flammeovirga yaeyamensis]MBB3697527.1 hypothetical protein [Flammeovirga yaeyamensis]NMF36221.1 hypothetical protein [Flammeovirga yaeyamensis]QWG02950.1 hypothetical protein KMW28_05055 [Flammeovirga yaeyamensis]